MLLVFSLQDAPKNASQYVTQQSTDESHKDQAAKERDAHRLGQDVGRDGLLCAGPLEGQEDDHPGDQAQDDDQECADASQPAQAGTAQGWFKPFSLFECAKFPQTVEKVMHRFDSGQFYIKKLTLACLRVRLNFCKPTNPKGACHEKSSWVSNRPAGIVPPGKVIRLASKKVRFRARLLVYGDRVWFHPAGAFTHFCLFDPYEHQLDSSVLI
jgi:hypothetical protein